MQLKVEHPTVEEIFKDFYEVPAFQREYVWKSEQVEALLADAQDALFDENGSPTQSEYFIGSIVAYKDQDVFQLIDGQQRITTLFICLCCVRDRRNDLSDTESLQYLESMIQDQFQTLDGTTGVRLRLKPLYEEAGDVLHEIAKGDFENIRQGKNLPASARNILNAYDRIYEYLEEEFGSNIVSLRRFQAHLTKRVRLVRIQTGNISEALRIFETINDRGVGLTALDLLKNLLFMHTRAPDQFERLTQVWKEMVHTIEKTKKGEKPLRFLRYFVLSRYPDARKNSKPLTEDDLYEWLSSQKDDIGISADPLGYARQLREAASQYEAHVAHPDGYLENIYQLSGRARQHLIIMLATDGLEPDELVEVSRQLEAVFVAFILAKEPTKALDIIYANAAPALRQFIAATPSGPNRLPLLRAHLDAWVKPEILKLKSRLDMALHGLSLERKTACRFVLCRLSQFLEQQAGCPVPRIGHYWNFHIEHILPCHPTEEQRNAFDDPSQYDQVKQKLGNLTLLEQAINCALGRDYFTEKKPHYQKSSIFLTKSLSQSQAVGTNSAFAKAAAMVSTPDSWHTEAIILRQAELKDLASALWGFGLSAETRH